MIDDEGVKQNQIILGCDFPALAAIHENKNDPSVTPPQSDIGTLGASTVKVSPAVEVKEGNSLFTSWQFIFVVILFSLNVILFISWKNISRKTDVLAKKA